SWGGVEGGSEQKGRRRGTVGAPGVVAVRTEEEQAVDGRELPDAVTVPPEGPEAPRAVGRAIRAPQRGLQQGRIGQRDEDGVPDGRDLGRLVAEVVERI